MPSRREFLAMAAAASLPIRGGVPRVDYHVHIGEAITVDLAIRAAERQGAKFGLLLHAGVKGHGYQASDDAGLRAWVHSLAGKPVFKGIEAEGLDWQQAFSKEALAELDYVQTDPLGMPNVDGSSARIWEPDFRAGNAQNFMDRYVEHHLRLLAWPIDILAVPTFLPDSLRPDYDRLWTEPRMRAVIDAAVKHRVAIEIESRFRVPGLRFVEMAKAAGATFAFGSNYQTPEGIGDISYGVEVYRRLHLDTRHFFRPGRGYLR